MSSETIEKLITLPDSEEILRRMKTVDDQPYLVEKFYGPFSRKSAGVQLVPMGVIMGLVLGVSDFSEGLPPIVGNMALMRIPAWVDALVDDKEFANEAKDFYASIG